MVAARPVQVAELDGAEPLLERLDLADHARENLARLAVLDEAALACGDGWAARVELEGVALLVRSDGARWEICLPRGADDDGAMHAAQRLHGLIGAQADGWDLDR